MTKIEAASLIANLLAAFPSAKFAIENANMYESGIADLGAAETQEAIGELIHSSKYLPTIAEIRQEVMRWRTRRGAAEDTARRLRLTRGDGSTVGPRPESWQPVLTRQIEASSRHQRLSEAWYAERGKVAPPDPGKAFLEIVKTGASGGDVRQRLRDEVLPGDQDVLERRFP